ncbi:T-cell surface glycoprotein CD8 beta chain-like [Centroberyx affinis]|uniref:T-cell surface glycoprotein CD8 beta chain-like n=1 Tax=Centroberyx affinis TaxID=166261 RepID=UPI003A5C6360
MMSYTLVTALLLCNLSWIPVSVSESQTVEVQPGEEVMLMCTKISSSPTYSEWFRLVNRSKPCCISSMYNSDETAWFCDGFQNGKFEMRSSVSTLFLKIKQVDLSDSGLYFCGFYIDGHTVIVNATYLKVQGNVDFDDETDDKSKVLVEKPDGITSLASVILGGVTVFLVMVIVGLVLKISQLQTAAKEELQPQRSENLDSDELKYAALSFHPKPKRSRRPASEKEVETNVVYAATR